MLPEKNRIQFIASKIDEIYLPGSIKNYDIIVSFSDLYDLFPKIDNVLKEEIDQALILLNFRDESKFDEMIFTNYR